MALDPPPRLPRLHGRGCSGPDCVARGSESSRPANLLSRCHPDADLIALAGQFIAGEMAVQDWPAGADGDLPEPEFSLAVSAQNDLISEMAGLHAITADGVAARARCLAIHNSQFDFSMDDPDTFTGRLVHDLMRDALALGGSGRAGV